MEDTFQENLIFDYFEKEKILVKSVVKIKGDVSIRKYYRISTDRGNFILAMYPEPLREDLKRYVILSEEYRKNSIDVPKIYYFDFTKGVSILEDLGDEILYGKEEITLSHINDILKILKKLREIEVDLNFKYRLNREKLRSELDFFAKYYLKLVNKDIKLHKLNEELDEIADKVNFREVFCHRDFMVRNLILKDNKIYLIDFQDSTYGPFFYDIASFLNDSISLKFEEVIYIFDRFLNVVGMTKNKEIEELFFYTSLQRMLKALGTFSKQLFLGNREYEKLFYHSLDKSKFLLEKTPEFPLLKEIISTNLKL